MADAATTSTAKWSITPGIWAMVRGRPGRWPSMPIPNPALTPSRLRSATIRESLNQLGSDTAYVVVNEPPIAAAGPDRLVAIGEVIDFGRVCFNRPGRSASLPINGDFGDGSQGLRHAGTICLPPVWHLSRDADGSRRLRYRQQYGRAISSPSSSTNHRSRMPVTINWSPRAKSSSTVSGSSDPDGTIARYEWDFGDGTQRAGRTPRHVYQKPGQYLVRLTVTDDSGTMRSSASDSIMVTINEAPIADAGPDLIAAPGQKVTLAASGSIDPDGDLTEFNWDFKDGNAASGERVEHSFDQPGTYRVRLSVRDDTGQPDAIDFDEAKVIVNAPPVAKAGPNLLAAPGDALQFDGAIRSTSTARSSAIAGISAIGTSHNSALRWSGPTRRPASTPPGSP